MAIRMQGGQVARLREALGLPASQLATVLGVHSSTVHRWEASGSQEVTIDGVAANVLMSLAQKVENDRRARQQAATVGDQVAQALAVGGALVALAILVDWLVSAQRR